MDPAAPTGGLAHLEQYGALGIIVTALLGLVILLVRQFVQHAIKSNEQLQQQNAEMQKENLKAMHAIVIAIEKLRTDLVYEFGAVLNSDPTVVRERDQPRERRLTRPPIKPREGG
jgi:hypothetical protein